MEDCTDLHIGACSIPIRRPARHWSVMLGDTNATRRTNFRIRLLTGCDGLEQDASHFRYRTHGKSSGDPTCKLCGFGPENLSGEAMHSKDTLCIVHTWCTELSLCSEVFVTSSIWLFLVCKYRGAGDV